jgi:RHS repeat-associated protein
VTAATKYIITTQVQNNSTAPTVVTLQQANAEGKWLTLATDEVYATKDVSIEVTPNFSSPMRLSYSLRKGLVTDNITVASINYIRVDKQASSRLVILCNTDADFSDDYRYGFNGQEKDNEVKGVGNSLDFGARVYDSRLGRFMSLDPWEAKYPSWSPYTFAFDNPIRYIDPTGKGGVYVVTNFNKQFNNPFIAMQQWSVTHLYSGMPENGKQVECGFISFVKTNKSGDIINQRSTGIIPGKSPSRTDMNDGPFKKRGEHREMEAHYHPTDVSGGYACPFSAPDISAIRAFTDIKNFTTFIISDGKRYAITITDNDLAKKFFAENNEADIQNKYNAGVTIFKPFTNALAEKDQLNYESAVINVIGNSQNSGMEFFETVEGTNTWQQITPQAKAVELKELKVVQKVKIE